MGLDNYFVKQCSPGETAPEVKIEPSSRLCGGIFSGGDSSFRGKVYAPFVLEVSGIDLYDDFIPAHVVNQMASDIESWLAEHEGDYEHGEWPIERAEIADLARVMRAHAGAEFGLASWW